MIDGSEVSSVVLNRKLQRIIAYHTAQRNDIQGHPFRLNTTLDIGQFHEAQPHTGTTELC